MEEVKRLQVKVKKLHEKAVIPYYAKSGDAGLDLTAVSKSIEQNYTEFDTGLSFEIPSGYVGLVFPRSSITNKDMMLKNSVGVIDSSYRGSVKLRFRMDYRFNGDDDLHYEVGDRVGQIIILPYPQVELVESAYLAFSDRDAGGFGSSGV